MMGNQCATPVAFTINFTGSTGLLDDDDFDDDNFDDDRTGSRIVWRSLMNCMIVQFMMFTDYNSGHWRCVRMESRRERESPKVKKGADPRRKSKLKVCCHFFNRLPIFLPTFKKSCKHFFPWLFVKYVEAGCFEGFVARRRLFGRLAYTVPTLICQSATVSNVQFWPDKKENWKESVVVNIFLCFDASSSLLRQEYSQIIIFSCWISHFSNANSYFFVCKGLIWFSPPNVFSKHLF